MEHDRVIDSSPEKANKVLSFPLQVLPDGVSDFKRHYEELALNASGEITVEMHDNRDGSLAIIGILLNMRQSISDEIMICLKNCQPRVKYLLSLQDEGRGFIFKEGV